MNARELREANKLWPQTLHAVELEAEIRACDPHASPITRRMLDEEKTRRSVMSYVAWDELAIALGVDVTSWGWQQVAKERIGYPRPAGPSRIASVRCESGRRNYCTCDTCF